CSVVRRNHRDHLHVGPRADAADLVLQRTVPTARQAGHQRGGRAGHRRDVHSHRAGVLSDAARRGAHPLNTKLLINGKLVSGAGDKEDVLDPATGKAIVKVGEASEGQIDNAVKAARNAFNAWSATAPKDRAALLLKLADRIDAEGAEFASIESQNCGKP